MSINDTINKELTKRDEENAHQNKIMLGSIRTRDKLLSMISHDLRGDIGKTIGIVDLIEKSSITPGDQIMLLKNLRKDATTTLETLENMLEWTRTQQDELNIHLSPYNVNRNLELIVGHFDYSLKSKRILVDLKIPDHLIIDGDRNMIDSVFRNLLGNALKFTPIDGRIRIHAEQLAATVRFTIEDSGVGMTQDQIENIQRKIQFTTTGTNREKGSGFGMLLVGEFLQKHNSKLHIESTPGEGTRFTFKLPLHIDISAILGKEVSDESSPTTFDIGPNPANDKLYTSTAVKMRLYNG